MNLELFKAPDLDVGVIHSGCCGMAGSFGYEAEHYDLSMKMAELDLLPAVRSSGDDVWIVADGTSCRRQILDGTGRNALHTVRVLEAALADRSNQLLHHREHGCPSDRGRPATIEVGRMRQQTTEPDVEQHLGSDS